MPNHNPIINRDLEQFTEDGIQTVFAIYPFGNSETRQERLKRWEEMGAYDSSCAQCATIPDHPTLSPFQPSHKASSRCRSGGRNHCTCDTCF